MWKYHFWNFVFGKRVKEMKSTKGVKHSLSHYGKRIQVHIFYTNIVQFYDPVNFVHYFMLEMYCDMHAQLIMVWFNAHPVLWNPNFILSGISRLIWFRHGSLCSARNFQKKETGLLKTIEVLCLIRHITTFVNTRPRTPFQDENVHVVTFLHVRHSTGIFSLSEIKDRRFCSK